MTNGLPSFLEQNAEGRTAYDLVLGAMLGGYLGLTISRQGLADGTYFDLAGLLIWNCLFVLCINASTDRFHRKNWWGAGRYAFFALASAILAVFAGSRLSVDPNILIVIFIVWMIFATLEIASASFAFLFGKDS